MFRKALTLLLIASSAYLNAQDYFPSKIEWLSKEPKDLGFNGNRLQEAIDFAESNEYSGHKDLRLAILESFRREPYHDIQ